MDTDEKLPSLAIQAAKNNKVVKALDEDEEDKENLEIAYNNPMESLQKKAFSTPATSFSFDAKKAKEKNMAEPEPNVDENVEQHKRGSYAKEIIRDPKYIF